MDQEFLAAAIHEYGGLVRHICRNVLGARPEDIEECISDVFVALWSAEAASSLEGNELKNYLCGIARHKAIDRYRRISNLPTFVFIDGNVSDDDALFFDPNYAETFSTEEDEEILADAVDALPSPDREIFILRYYYFERIKAIADKLALSEKVIENKLYRGKLSLRKTLTEKGLER
jgi:RNA polymerase sigma-70 factor (ECF subfamily)